MGGGILQYKGFENPINLEKAGRDDSPITDCGLFPVAPEARKFASRATDAEP